jgi:hypothetical protein
VSSERSIDGLEAALLRRALERGERIGEDGLAVVEQPADQGALAVVDAAAGEEAQQSVVFELHFGQGFAGGHQK